MRDRRKALVVIGAALAIVAARHPVASVRLITHDAGDPAPRRMMAAIDLGLAGISILYTWTHRVH